MIQRVLTISETVAMINIFFMLRVRVVFMEPIFGLGLSITLHLIFYNLNNNLIYVSSRMFNQEMMPKYSTPNGDKLI
ncbi:hypothetical protein [Plasmodium yoelii yoelii]|uniref:Uncharacterized protein n=1 Tax=Plasmodium yoelii yoelii TaxID=73239 RepID=Q7RBC5_PLAYO|nr:hypothetical protein [Plasmodium yoelii yoelii]